MEETKIDYEDENEERGWFLVVILTILAQFCNCLTQVDLRT